MKLKRLSKDYRVISFWLSHLEDSLFRHSQMVRKEESGKHKVFAIQNHLYEARQLLDEVFQGPLGRALMEEIREQK